MNRLLVCFALVAVLAGICLGPSDARSQDIPPQGKILFYGYAGASLWDMTDVNNWIASFESFLRGEPVPEFDPDPDPNRPIIPANFDEFGASWDFGGGIMFQLMKRIGLAVEYSYKPQSLSNAVFYTIELNTGDRVTNLIQDDIDTNVQDVQLQLYWWPPIDDGLFLTVGAGMGWSSQTESLFISATDPDDNQRLDGDWTASGVAASVSAGYHFDAFWGTDFTFRGGYNFLNQGVPSGTTTLTTIDGTVDAPGALPLESVDWDYSGFFFTLSWGIGFGGGDDNG